MRLTVSYDDSEKFYRSGKRGAEWIRDLLHRHNIDLASVGSLLDFGCGCGRVIRHWQSLEGVRVHGADYNPYLVEWCRTHLPFADFHLTPPAVELELADNSLGLVYAISVFTHLDRDLQRHVLDQLARVLKPGGLLLLTLHGSTRLDAMSVEERSSFDAGEMVVRRSERAGSNACTTFHPEVYIRSVLADGFKLLELVPGGAQDVNQDAVLLQKL